MPNGTVIPLKCCDLLKYHTTETMHGNVTKHLFHVLFMQYALRYYYYYYYYIVLLYIHINYTNGPKNLWDIENIHIQGITFKLLFYTNIAKD